MPAPGEKSGLVLGMGFEKVNSILLTEEDCDALSCRGGDVSDIGIGFFGDVVTKSNFGMLTTGNVNSVLRFIASTCQQTQIKMLPFLTILFTQKVKNSNKKIL